MTMRYIRLTSSEPCRMSRAQVSQPNGAAGGAGHAVLPPPEVILADDNQPLPNVYGNITGARRALSEQDMLAFAVQYHALSL